MTFLQNVVIRKIEEIARATTSLCTKLLPYIYAKTVATRPLRRLSLHQCAFNLKSSSFANTPDQFPHKMLIELATLHSATYPLDADARKRNIMDYLVAEESVPEE
jgi:hypothetical protein